MRSQFTTTITPKLSAATLAASASRSPRSRRQRQQQHWGELIAAALPSLLPAVCPVQPPQSPDIKVFLDVAADVNHQPTHATSSAPSAGAAARPHAHVTPLSSPLKIGSKGKGALLFQSKQEFVIGHAQLPLEDLLDLVSDYENCTNTFVRKTDTAVMKRVLFVYGTSYS